MEHEQVSLSLPKDLVKRIDEARGIASRSAYCTKILDEHTPKKVSDISIQKWRE